MQPDLLLSGNENYDLDLNQAGDPDPVIFLRPKVEILDECDDEPLADYTCKFCKSHFVSYTALQIHHQTCVSCVPTSHSYCTLCNSHFSSSHDLQAHNLTQHGHEMDMNSGQYFQNRKGIGISVQVQPYKCNVCGSWFITKVSLVNHLLSHSEDRPFPCRYPGCGKSFKSVHTLASHRRATHSNGFSCKFPNCDLTFGSTESLKDHVRTHLSKL